MADKNHYQSLKEYWADPKRNRRQSAGRRESDFTVCPYHEQHEEQDEKDKQHICGKIKELKSEREKNFLEFKRDHDTQITSLHGRVDRLMDEIVGKKMFALFVSIFLGVVILFGGLNYHLFNSIKKDLQIHIEEVEKKIVPSSVFNKP